MAEIILSDAVKERLNKIDWDGLKKTTGITREQIEKMPTVANQLAFQGMTDLVFGSTEFISGQFSLRAIPGKEGELWRVKAYTIEREKSVKDDIFLYGRPITSEKAKEALFERTSWENSEGKKVYGRANANAGRPIAIEREVNGEKKKEYYLVGLHEPTNRIVGMPVEAVKNMFLGKDENGNSREVSVYGVKLDEKQLTSLCNGEHVILNGCKNKAGEEFSTAVQFDPVRRQIVPSHPTFLKEALRAGVDIVGARKEAPAEAPAKKAVKTQKPAETPAEKKGRKINI